MGGSPPKYPTTDHCTRQNLAGRQVLLHVNCDGNVEVALVQGRSLLKSGTDDDALIFIAAASLAANCFIVPRTEAMASAIVIVDVCFDTVCDTKYAVL